MIEVLNRLKARTITFYSGEKHEDELHDINVYSDEEGKIVFSADDFFLVFNKEDLQAAINNSINRGSDD